MECTLAYAQQMLNLFLVPQSRKIESLPTENDNWRKASINGMDSMSPENAKEI